MINELPEILETSRKVVFALQGLISLLQGYGIECSGINQNKNVIFCRLTIPGAMEITVGYRRGRTRGSGSSEKWIKDQGWMSSISVIAKVVEVRQ